ncbi:LCP family protein [Ammoniphilus sp. 3BR4]|uniref:LCP family protein n=1 Tax=Ammoniphilus sp. 3BR4 TaxID=3158265 RepID=UPI0034669140
MGIRVLWLFFITFVILTGYYGSVLYNFSERINQNGDNQRAQAETKTEPIKLPEWKGTEPVSILLLGTDKRETESSMRSDTILLLNLNPVTKQAYLFSILRDTWIKVPGYGSNRINTSFEMGGPDLTAKTVEALTGLSIQYYMTTDFEGFEKMVDALGGLDLYVEKDMDYLLYENNGYYDIHLKEGMQRLDGHKALQYVRFRHDKMGDFSRTERQRKLLKALASQAKSHLNAFNIPKILNDLSPYISTNMETNDMLRFASLATKVRWTEMGTEQIPPFSILKEKRVNGGQVIDPNIEETKIFIHDLLSHEVAQRSSSGK